MQANTQTIKTNKKTIRVVKTNKKTKKRKKMKPFSKIIISIIALVSVGVAFLALPISHKQGVTITFSDNLFTALSSVSGSGLSSVGDIIDVYSTFGLVIIAFLMELGSVSFLSIIIFIINGVGGKTGVASTFLMKEALNVNSTKSLYSTIITIIVEAFVIQVIGAYSYLAVFTSMYPGDIMSALAVSIFTSISAFGNAGMIIFPTEFAINVLSGNVAYNLITIFLMISGGLGFIAITEVVSKRSFKKISATSKIIFYMTFGGIIAATAIFSLMQPKAGFIQNLFLAVNSTQSGGFVMQDYSTFSTPVVLVIMILVFVGASPCSTGGGIKNTTIFVIFSSIIAFARGKEPIVFYRKIASDNVIKAFLIVIISIVYVFVIVTCLAIANKNTSLQDIVLETVSAFGNNGVSSGLSNPSMNLVTKLLLVFTMFFGRLGPITMVSVFNKNWLSSSKKIDYIEEKIIVG
ncbi:MAG: hypothetical protein LBV51_02715 [Acholeplasmatales bacterium]|jgi:trk system potassium uptake protein TrkH|nr:hypothetical protein [Acholeplasmatales bacterium]